MYSTCIDSLLALCILVVLYNVIIIVIVLSLFSLSLSHPQSDDVGRIARAALIMERMVNQNSFDEIAQGIIMHTHTHTLSLSLSLSLSYYVP